MSAVTLTPAQRELLRQTLEASWAEPFALQLEQFDADCCADCLLKRSLYRG